MTRYSHNHIVARLKKYGLTHRSAAFASRAVMRAIRELLVEGYPVTLPNIGRLWFGFRKGRTVNNSPRSRMPRVQPDSHPLKFTQSTLLHRQLRNVKPKHHGKRKPSPAQLREQEGNPI